MFGIGKSKKEKYEERANKGDRDAQCELAVLYQFGREGVPQNEAEALKWFRRAAEQGQTEAAGYVGSYYEYGRGGVSVDYYEAAKWYAVSANGGWGGPMFNLGRLYEQGKGVPKDLSEAIRLYKLAAKKGDEDAKKRLKALGV